MKIGFRTPSLKRSFKARTTGRLKRAVKRSVNPFYGRRGVGLITNPKRSLYNRIYHRTTFGVGDVARAAGRGTRGAGGQSFWVHLLLLFTTFGIGNVIYALSSSRSSSMNSASPSASTAFQAHVVRGGLPMPADEVFAARTSGDFERMRRALDLPTNWVDRHFLLLSIVEEAYRLRSDPQMAAECARVAEIHLSEFPQIAPTLVQEFGTLPRVPTFQHYATLLTEQSNFDRAVRVCEVAEYYGLEDGTKSGFPGRIARIRKKQGTGDA